MELFNYIISLSLRACVLVPLVAAVRMLIDRYPKKYCYALWLMVFVSLVVKINVTGTIDTPVSQIQHTIQQQYDNIMDSYTEDIVIHHDISQAYHTAVEHGVEPIINEEANYVVVAADRIEPPHTVKTSVMPKAQLVWLAGMLVLLIAYIKNLLNILAATKFAVHYKSDIYYSESITSPFVFGVVKPKIYLPYSIAKEQAEFVISHEIVHLKRLDHLVKPLCFFISIIHWFNPFVWIAFWLMNKDMELSCDEEAVKNFDTDSKKNYCNALLQFALKDNTYKMSTVMFGESDCSSRIKNVLNFKEPKKLISALLVLVVLAVAVVSITAEKESVPDDNIETENVISADEIKQHPGHITVVPDDKDIAFIWPAAKEAERVVNLSRGFTGQYPAHDGIDILGKLGSEIYAAADGVVAASRETADFNGNYIIIDHGNGYRTLYAHCDQLLVSEGSTVAAGDVIATMGSTGNSTGVHLHFGISKDYEYINPFEFVTDCNIISSHICSSCGGQVSITYGQFGDWVRTGQQYCEHDFPFGIDLILERAYMQTSICDSCGFSDAQMITENRLECHGFFNPTE